MPGDDHKIWSARELHPFPYSPQAVARGTLQGKGTPAIGEAHEATDDSALIEPLVLTAKCLVAQLGQFNETINEFDRKIRGDCTKRKIKHAKLQFAAVILQSLHWPILPGELTLF